MKLWFTHASPVPIREQMATQIRLAILAGDLKPGDRLPSVRELARRFHLHPNTASAGYQHLVREGWLTSRHGSGVYVAARSERHDGMAQHADRLLAEMLRIARSQGIAASEIRSAMERWLEIPRPERIVLIEPDKELRNILMQELRQVSAPLEQVSAPLEAGDWPVRPQALERAVILCLPSKEHMLRPHLPVGCELRVLPVRSAPSSMAAWLPQSREFLIVVASRWDGFLEQARTMLVAAGFAEEALLLRDVRRPGWTAGLETASAILCDTVTAGYRSLPKGKLVIPFPILADTAGEMLLDAVSL